MHRNGDVILAQTRNALERSVCCGRLFLRAFFKHSVLPYFYVSLAKMIISVPEKQLAIDVGDKEESDLHQKRNVGQFLRKYFLEGKFVYTF